MKLIYFANVRFPNKKAHGIQIAKMCEALVLAGVELELIVPNKRLEYEDDPKSFYGLSCSIPITRLFVLDIFSRTPFGFYLSSLSFGLSSLVYLLFHRSYDAIYSIDLDPLSFLASSSTKLNTPSIF